MRCQRIVLLGVLLVCTVTWMQAEAVSSRRRKRPKSDDDDDDEEEAEDPLRKAECKVAKTTGISPGQPVEGLITLEQKDEDSPTVVKASLEGFDTEDDELVHGFHIHQTGDLGNACSNAKGHYNPHLKTHGAPNEEERHVGDLGNIKEDSDGNVKNFEISSNIVSLRGDYTVIGRAFVIHAGEDDLGVNKSWDSGSNTTGNAGARLACCIIEDVTEGAAALQMSLLFLIASFLVGQYIQ